jgi:hypothetical protein
MQWLADRNRSNVVTVAMIRWVCRKRLLVCRQDLSDTATQGSAGF